MKKLIAHRGLKNDSKENTISAFKEAIANDNYAGFECDIRTTKDKIFIVNHNPMIDLDIISLTDYKTLKQKYNTITLEDVLKLNTSKIILLEIKENNIDIKKFQNLIQKYNNKNVYIMSFFNSVIKKMYSNKKNEKLGVLNYVLNSEENYDNYDFICLLENIMSEKLEDFFIKKQKEVMIYGIHNLKKDMNIYKNSYFITDDIIK